MPSGSILDRYPEAGPITSPNAYIRALLLDKITGVDVGWWLPWSPFHEGTFEVDQVTGTLAATVNLLISNAALMPGNGFTITLGGSVSTGDILTLSIESSIFPQGFVLVAYTVKSTDTSLTILAASIAAALNSAITALNIGGLVPQENLIQMAALSITAASGVITIISQQPLFPFFSIPTIGLSAGASESATIAQYDSGLGEIAPSCSLTAPNAVAFDVPAAWIKAACPTYSTGTISAILQGNLP